jgi:hypothetical protein
LKRAPKAQVLASQRLQLALTMFQDGYQLMRARLARENRHASAAQLDAMMRAWLLARNGVEDSPAPATDRKGRSKRSPRPRSQEPLSTCPGFQVPVARVPHLIALKVLSESPRRPQDRMDLDALLATASPREIQRARELVRTISARGTGRKKNLLGVLERYVRRALPRR